MKLRKLQLMKYLKTIFVIFKHKVNYKTIIAYIQKKILHAIGRCCYGVILSSNNSKQFAFINNFLFIVVQVDRS